MTHDNRTGFGCTVITTLLCVGALIAANFFPAYTGKISVNVLTLSEDITFDIDLWRAEIANCKGSAVVCPILGQIDLALFAEEENQELKTLGLPTSTLGCGSFALFPEVKYAVISAGCAAGFVLVITCLAAGASGSGRGSVMFVRCLVVLPVFPGGAAIYFIVTMFKANCMGSSLEQGITSILTFKLGLMLYLIAGACGLQFFNAIAACFCIRLPPPRNTAMDGTTNHAVFAPAQPGGDYLQYTAAPTSFNAPMQPVMAQPPGPVAPQHMAINSEPLAQPLAQPLISTQGNP